MKSFFSSFWSQQDEGMTLVEVLVAVFIFSIFIMSFMTNQGDNIQTSIRMKEELKLKDIGEIIINEQLINPPEVEVVQGDVEIRPVQSREYKTYEENEDYEFAINTYKLALPDYDKIVGADQQSQEENQQQSGQKMIYEKFKSNMEKQVFQMMVTVRHKASGQFLELSTWFSKKAQVNLGI